MKATESDGDHLSRTEKVLVYREIGSKEEVLVHWEGFQR